MTTNYKPYNLNRITFLNSMIDNNLDTFKHSLKYEIQENKLVCKDKIIKKGTDKEIFDTLTMLCGLMSNLNKTQVEVMKKRAEKERRFNNDIL